MSPGDSPQGSEGPPDGPPVQCPACESAFRASDAPSFLLLDQLTVPLVGCDDHLSQFTDVCGYTTEDTAELLDHRPAGGVRCPSCHLAPYNPGHPLIPVQDGAVAVLACPEHQSEIVDRFQTGLSTQQQLTSTIDAP